MEWLYGAILIFYSCIVNFGSRYGVYLLSFEFWCNASKDELDLFRSCLFTLGICGCLKNICWQLASAGFFFRQNEWWNIIFYKEKNKHCNAVNRRRGISPRLPIFTIHVRNKTLTFMIYLIWQLFSNIFISMFVTRVICMLTHSLLEKE